MLNPINILLLPVLPRYELGRWPLKRRKWAFLDATGAGGHKEGGGVLNRTRMGREHSLGLL